MTNDITIEEALNLKNNLYIDVRSPKEFEEDSLPNAINIPILDNEQRKIVGIKYKHNGAEEARLAGIELISKELPLKINTIKEKSKGKQPVIYCWRGGMRSKAMSEILNLAGINNYRINGGYKEYRKYVYNLLYNNCLDKEFIVLYGLTGTGKTEILDELKKINIPVLDYEFLANHRGSVFGSVGLGQQPSQKKFETEIFKALNKYKNSKFIIVEGESKKIGKIYIPDQIFKKMKDGKHILVYTNLNERIKRIIKEYLAKYEEKENIIVDEIKTSINFLEKHIGKNKVNYLNEMVVTGNYEDVVSDLLINYYDSLYKHPIGPSDKYNFSLDSTNINAAVKSLLDYINNLYRGGI